MVETQEQWRAWVVRLAQETRRLSPSLAPVRATLERLAARHMTSPLRCREGADDEVQPVCRTFFRRARNGQFDLPDQECLWRLLGAITLTKIREEERFHRREKRELDRECDAAAAGDDAPAAIDGLVASDRPPKRPPCSPRS